MYIELFDETEKVSKEIIEQTEKLLSFAADYIKLADSKEMSVTFVDNARSQEINLEYREKDAPTDVISLEYKPDEDEFFFDEDMDIPEELMDELDPFVGELFISIDKAAEQAADYGHSLEREYGWLAVRRLLTLMVTIIILQKKKQKCSGLQEEILTAYGLKR